MASSAMKLDTLAYAKKLIAAGCTPQLAEAHASAQQDVLVEISEDYLSQFVTKQDLNSKFGEVNAKFDAVDTKFDILEQRLEQKMTNLALKMTIALGGLVVAGVVVLAAIIKL